MPAHLSRRAVTFAWLFLFGAGLAITSGCRQSSLQVGTRDGGVSADASGAPDAAGVDSADAVSDGPNADGACLLACPASFTSLGLSGEMSFVGSGPPLDFDAFAITVCIDTEIDEQCVLMERQPFADAQAASWACGDASPCDPKVYGASASTNVRLANLAITREASGLYSLRGTVMFALARDNPRPVTNASISIRQSDYYWLSQMSPDRCTTTWGCCGNLPYQSCQVTVVP